MRRFFSMLSLLAAMVINAQVQEKADSIWLTEQWQQYVNALRADSAVAAQSRLNATIEGFMVPLKKPYEAAVINEMRQKINQTVSDPTLRLTPQQQQRCNEIDSLLAAYESEARRMVAAFKPADAQVVKKIELFTTHNYDGMMVSEFCKGKFTTWYQESSLPGFIQSQIPYLALLAQELSTMLKDLSDPNKATPDLLRQFMDTEFRIAMNHKAKPATTIAPTPNPSVMESPEEGKADNQ